MTVLPVILPGTRRPLWTAGAARHDRGGEAPVLGVFSARGGMGRTTVATAMAARLVRRGARVLLVDADLDVSALSLTAPVGSSEGFGHGDLRVVRAVPGALDARSLRLLSAGAETIVADMPLWTEPPAQVLESFVSVVLVADPEPASVAATARWIRRYRDNAAGEAELSPLHLVLNRVRRGDDVEVGHAIARAARDVGVPLSFVGVLPWDDAAWIRARRAATAPPLAEDAPFGYEIDEMLDRVEQQQEVPAPGPWREELETAAAAGHSGRLAAVAQVG